MYTAIAKLEGVPLYQQGRYHNTPKLEREGYEDYEKRTWIERAHFTPDGHVFIPPMQLKLSLEAAAKYVSRQIPGKGKATYTKHFRSGVMVFDPLVLPLKREDIKEYWVHVPSDGVKGGGKRVPKCFPTIEHWEGNVEYNVFDETVTLEVLKEHLEEAGRFIGIGVFRPGQGGYNGRYKVHSVKKMA
ncbi:MAG TPA: hypothetical protein VMW10_05665 [Alphaproteobacteria bacterium]|nr:hypothetical protein [Alphaproteobacteria bacterium]